MSLVSASVAHLVRYAIGLEPLEMMLRNVSLTVLGDTLESIFILVIVIQLRRAYRTFYRAISAPGR